MAKPISDEVEAESDPKKKQKIKTEAVMAEAEKMVGKSIKHVSKEYDLTLDSMVEEVAGDGVTVITAMLTITDRRTGADVTPPTLNPASVRNPPMLVPDPNGDEDLGTPEKPRKVREDPAAAYVQYLTDLFHSLDLP